MKHDRILRYLEDRRKLAKHMMELSAKDLDVKDEQYYLGRMNEAKMVKQALIEFWRKQK